MGVMLFLVFIFFFFEKLERENEARILFVGDMNFDRHIRKAIYNSGEDYIFSCISDFLKSYDLVVGNLEGPITENPSTSIGTISGSPENFTFTFLTGTANLLKRHNISLVNLGNNHIGDFGRKGFSSTKKYLDESGVNFFGGLFGDEPIFREKLGGAEISFVSYNQFGGSSVQEVAQKIKMENQEGRIVIVYAHWGEEYVPASLHIKNIAKTFAQSGARAVIGSHPHIILGSEEIGETSVYYSLGNFIFDQYWNNEVSTGLVLEMIIKGEKISFLEHQVKMQRDGRTCPLI